MGHKTQNIIEINGKRYDALSGKYLGEASADSIQGRPLRTAPKSVDGFRRATAPVPQKPKKVHTPASHVAAHKPEPAKTLMRTAVRKPTIKSPEVIKAQTRTDILAKAPKQIVAPKLSHTSVDPKRQKKATQMLKSPAVSRYGNVHDAKPVPSVSFVTPTPGNSAIRSLDDFRAAPRTSVRPALTNSSIPVAAETRYDKQPDIFEQALAKATSHEQTFDDSKVIKKGRRFARLVTASMCLLLVAGFVAYLNTPMLSMRMASTRAGINAKLPGYSPAGYTFGDLSYSPGNVTVSYKSGDNTRKFDITQRSSDWDSQALLTNFVASANKAYQTYERAGRTIYFFGNNTATWVDSGIWYTVNGNNSLTKSQLLDLAGSI